MVARLGRVLYWLFTASAAVIVGGCILIAVFLIQRDSPSAIQGYVTVGIGAAGGVLTYLAGRALRYVLANE